MRVSDIDESKSEKNRLKRMAEYNTEVVGRIKDKSKRSKLRNLSICPLAPDPPEIIELISELKKYLKTVDFRNDSIYSAYFTFDYKDVTYRMDDASLSTAPAVMYKAESYISEKLMQLGATNIGYHEHSD